MKSGRNLACNLGGPDSKTALLKQISFPDRLKDPEEPTYSEESVHRMNAAFTKDEIGKMLEAIQQGKETRAAMAHAAGFSERTMHYRIKEAKSPPNQ